MAAEITITFSKEGKATVAVKGVKGRSCKDATRELEQALGTVTNDTPTKEMYEQPERTDNRIRR